MAIRVAPSTRCYHPPRLANFDGGAIVRSGERNSSSGIGGLSSRVSFELRGLQLLVIAAAGLLALGLAAPIITLHKFVIVSNTFSVVSGVWQLLREGRWFLFTVITLFSVVLPVLKLLLLFHLTRPRVRQGPRSRRYLRWMHDLGRWSMLDVFVVAVLVVAVKLGMIASIETHYGLYAFAASVILTMVITARVVMLYDRAEGMK